MFGWIFFLLFGCSFNEFFAFSLTFAITVASTFAFILPWTWALTFIVLSPFAFASFLSFSLIL